MSRSKTLFLMSGSIAAFKACQVISRLVQSGDEVQVAATPSTFEFIGAMTLEGLTGKKPLSDFWERGRAMDHIHLTRWADRAILCPASANTLARLAHGMAYEVVSALALAWPKEKPFWIFPAMNHEMLAAQATQENLRILSERGFRVAPTSSGSLACGEEGQGRMLEPEEILNMVNQPARGRVLVTGGSTREPIDGIRFISNVSTGQTAATICDELRAQGWQVTYVCGRGAAQPVTVEHKVDFDSFGDLDNTLREELGRTEFSAIIHCAAVSDFSVDGACDKEKLSSASELNLRLKPNFKILPRLKEYSRNKQTRVIGFKLTLNASPMPAARSLLGPAVDAVVANEWSSVGNGKHPGTLITADGEVNFTDVKTLSAQLHEYLLRRS